MDISSIFSVNLSVCLERSSNKYGTLKFCELLHNNKDNIVGIQNMGMFNLLKPTSHVMHQQFNIQQLYALSTLYLCVLYLSENKQRLVPLTA